MKKRIHRVLAIARSYGYNALVLGAWGCGAFHNDPHRTAADFRDALANDFSGAFSDIVFAIADWSQERRFLISHNFAGEEGSDAPKSCDAIALP